MPAPTPRPDTIGTGPRVPAVVSMGSRSTLTSAARLKHPDLWSRAIAVPRHHQVKTMGGGIVQRGPSALLSLQAGHRFVVIRIDLPPLRERREDIPALCSYFIAKFRARYKPDAQELPAELLNAFVAYEWPGNIRQLENCIKRFLVLPDYHALLADLSPANVSLKQPKRDIPVEQPVSLLDVGAIAAERAEQELVRRVLEETRGNRKLAARKMNICYKALLNKLKRWSGSEAATTLQEIGQQADSEAA